ncbi:hypothetical protein NW762_005749 [Fusarium torreyae]|uniref:Small s protein n=1 Tax=Fusarium torreyae TaxID=1237075 RepID=A0A9W8VG75_9HYPO|nr:hypothetical protein NW762_005749 [Fusarium torreyae]
MSGAEAALLGVGILCNAMQIITFCRDALQVYRNVSDGRSPDPRLEYYLRNVKASFDEMNQSALNASQIRPLNSDQQQIVDVGRQVHDCVDELQRKFAELHVDDASKRGVRGKLAASRKSAATLWRGKELEGIEKSVQRHEHLLHGLLLHHICNQAQAAEISSIRSFHQLDTTLQEIVTQLAEGCTKVSDLSSQASLETRDRIVEEHTTTRTVIDQRITAAENTLHSSISNSMNQVLQDLHRRDHSRDFEKQHEQLLQSLRFPEMNSRMNHISENYPGTFSWIFDAHHSFQSDHSPSSSLEQSDDDTRRSDEDDEEDEDDDMVNMDNMSESAFTEDSTNLNDLPTWLESDSKLFWVSGKPASGKSSLMKFIAFNTRTSEHLRVWHPDAQIITHFFWKPGQELQRNVEGMVFSLLYQVLASNPNLAQGLWEAQKNIRHKRSHSDWALNELAKSLCWALRASGEAFCIFLDGLDEAKELGNLPFPEWTSAQVILDLLEIKNVKLCASSREEHAFCSFFRSASRLRIHQLNKTDIRHFANQRLDTSKLNSTDRLSLLGLVVWKASGVFLWVALVLDSLNRAIRMGVVDIYELKERLDQTPTDLKRLFIDMWGRAGDDGELPSYRVIASRYFNLTITAKTLDEDWSNRNEKKHLQSWMRSLLVMATALDDKPIASILSTGRDVQVEELRTKRSRVEDELRVVCRGLLEVTEMEDYYDPWLAGDKYLFEYNRKKVEFIHRCAFDFFMETEVGRESLEACCWSRTEQASRLLAAHLIRARFVCARPSPDNPRKIGNKTYHDVFEEDHQLHMALVTTWTQFRGEISIQNNMLQAIRDWQLSGLFCDHAHWKHPRGSKSPSNPKELEFLEQAIRAAWDTAAISYVTDLLDRYSIICLVDSIPVIIRGLHLSYDDNDHQKMPLKLIDYILNRLTSMASVEGRYVYSQGQDAVQDAIRLLHSWFITYFLEFVSESEPFEVEFEDEDVHTEQLLRRFTLALPSIDDWQYPLKLEFRDRTRRWFSLTPADGWYVLSGDYAVVVANFYTAYRLLGDLMLDRLQQTLDIQAPEGVKSRFEIVLVGDENNEYYKPATKYHSRIQHFLQNALYETDKDVKQNAWSNFLQDISDGLEPVDSHHVLGYCIHELGKSDLEFIPPWSIRWFVEKTD